MSDFDKEAEREKLREQFAEDERKQENTRRMSELLLKGATMTDTHCDTCGDPIFRWDGQEFCPTCSAQQGAQAQEQPQPGTTEEAAAEPPADVDDATSGVEVEPETPPAEPTGTPEPEPSTPAPREETAPEPATGERATPSPEPSGGAAGDLSGARESLVRTLARFASEAESATNPADARERLAAVEAAADALAAVRRAER